jgi:hypothetical protein
MARILLISGTSFGVSEIPKNKTDPTKIQGPRNSGFQTRESSATRPGSGTLDRIMGIENPRKWNVVLALAVLFAACSSSTPEPAEQQVAAQEPAKAEPTAIPELEQQLGKQVTMTGLAVNMKLGAGLVVGDHTLFMDGMDSWPEGYYEGEGEQKKVTVKGTLIVRHDLPVFVQEEGTPIMSGMPVPPGTDLHEASRRYLLTDFTYEPQ